MVQAGTRKIELARILEQKTLTFARILEQKTLTFARILEHLLFLQLDYIHIAHV